MPKTNTCTTCDGSGKIDALVSQHDDVTERVTCPKCKGAGVIHTMTDDEERDYHDNYW